MSGSVVALSACQSGRPNNVHRDREETAQLRDSVGETGVTTGSVDQPIGRPLYTVEERLRRDASRWTLVQGILAPVQFLVFIISACLVVRYLMTGLGYEAATLSVIIKTFVLYTIMITGAIWEHDVYGQYLFAPAFYWEDMVSMLVLALHTAYLVSLVWPGVTAEQQMVLALAAYATYVVNATQFVIKLRQARMQRPASAMLPQAQS
jgi:3-vinyl bacteriochlorophyllide hydratase